MADPIPNAIERLEALEAKLATVEASNSELAASNEKLSAENKAATELLNEAIEAKAEPEAVIEPEAVEAPEAPVALSAEDFKAIVSEGNAALKADFDAANAKIADELASVKEIATKATAEASVTKIAGGEDTAADLEANASGTDSESEIKKTYAEVFESDARVNPSKMTLEAAASGTMDGIHALTAMEMIHGTPAEFEKKQNA